MQQILTGWGFDATSGNIWYNYRTLLMDADGLGYSWSVENQVPIATAACSGSGSSGSGSPSFMAL